MNININPVNSKGDLVSETDLISAVAGTRKGLEKLGRLATAIRKIDISFDQGDEGGLRMTICYADPIGNESFYEIDWRLFPRMALCPSAAEISGFLLHQNTLVRHMKDFLEKSKARFSEAQETLMFQLQA